MDYLLFSLVPVVTFLGWLLWVRWDSGRYPNQRRIERRLQGYPLRGTEDELLLLQMIDEANPPTGSSREDGQPNSLVRHLPLSSASPAATPPQLATLGTPSDSSSSTPSGSDTRGRVLTFGPTRWLTPESPTPPTATTSNEDSVPGNSGPASHEGLER